MIKGNTLSFNYNGICTDIPRSINVIFGGKKTKKTKKLKNYK